MPCDPTPVKMNFALILVLFCLQIIQSSCSQVFYFPKAVKDISASLNNLTELNEKLELLNTDCNHVELHKSTLAPYIIKDYVKVQERVSSILLNVSSADFKNSIWIDFGSHLIVSLEDYENLLNPQGLGDVLGFLFATMPVNYAPRVRRALSKMIPRLTEVSKSKVHQYLIKFAHANFVIATPPVFGTKIFGARNVKAFAEEFIQKIFTIIYKSGLITGSHFDLISVILVSVLKDEDVTLSDSVWEILLRGFRMSLTGIKGINEKVFEQLLETINLAAVKVKHNRCLVEIIIDICFDENLAMTISPDKINSFYLGLIINCSKLDIEYFKDAFDEAKAEVKEHIGEYLDYLTFYNTSRWCVGNLLNLGSSSDNGKFRLALSSAKKLRNINQAHPEVIQIAYDLHDAFNAVLYRSTSVLFDPSHESNSLMLQILAHVSLLDIEMSDDDDDEEDDDESMKPFGNVVFSIGSLIVKSKFNEPYPQELVNDVMPRLDCFIDKLLKIIKVVQKQTMNIMDLMAYMSFIRLHSNTELIESAVNEIYFVFIISMPIRDKGYAQIKDFDDIDEYSVMRAGFFYFIEKYNRMPCKADHPHLAEYLRYLIMRRLLSKVELLAISRFFSSYGITI